MKYIINGALGKMGREIISLLGEENIAAKVDKYAQDKGYFSKISEYTGMADVIVDFSYHSSVWEICKYANEKKIPLVIASTAHTDEEKRIIETVSENIPVFLSYNMSSGIFLTNEFVKILAEELEDAKIKISETHHKDKKDAPSGTALMFKAAAVSGGYRREIEITSLREGSSFGKHSVIFETDNEIITIKHEAKNRTLFARGAICASEFIVTRKNGLYGMKELLKNGL